MKQILTKTIGLVLLCFFSLQANAQITTSTLTGKVIAEDGEALIGANVVATHTPSGTTYGVISLDGGRYFIPNMRVGGPYTLTVSYVGYETTVQADIYLTLGEKGTQNVTLAESGVILDDIVISGQVDPVLNKDRTGPATTIDRNTHKV